MTDIVEDAEALAGNAAAIVVKDAEAFVGSVIHQIASGATKVFSAAETVIDADYAKVKAALPASAQGNLDAVVSDIKQGASDIISLVGAVGTAYLPELTKTVETGLDEALVAATNGEALPLVPIVNGGIDDIVAVAVSSAQAWGLAQKAALAKAA